MPLAKRNPKPFIPALAGFYAWVEPHSYTLLRLAVGALLIPEGSLKVMAGLHAISGGMARQHFPLPWLFALIVIIIETLGGFCVAIGLLTRFWAAAIAIEMAVIAFDVQWHNGYGRVAVFLVWGLAAFVIALRGGGPYSVDRLIGREL